MEAGRNGSPQNPSVPTGSTSASVPTTSAPTISSSLMAILSVHHSGPFSTTLAPIPLKLD